MAWPRRATETLLNNYITRRSCADRRLASATRCSLVTGGCARSAFPALVLCGPHDPQYPPACAGQLATVIPGARLVFSGHGGHYP